MSDPKAPEGPDTVEKNPRDGYGFQENPAEQGLKKPPTDFGVGEDSGEWTRGGGSNPEESGND